MSVVAFRRFKIPAIQETQFFAVDDSNNQNFCREDLAKSGLIPEDMEAVTFPMMPVKEGAQAGYMIPYNDLDGNPLCDAAGVIAMFRIRMKYPEYSRESRYTQPGKEHLAKLNLPPYIPYIHRETLTLPGEELICAEGEKKAAAIIKYLKLPAFGIGGCQLWRHPDGSGSVHPWIRELLHKRSISRLTIVPDGDIHRYDISTAYGNFARALELEGITVRILDPGNKIDDLLAQWGDDAHTRWSSLGALELKDLVQSPSALIKRYGLAFKTDTKDRPIVHQHTSNVTKLLEEHPAFPKIWRNLDNARVMVDQDQAQPGLTEMDIANYFQHNLGFDKVTNKLILQCIDSISKRNAKSPFLDYIKSLEWDGVKRIDEWMIKHWGVTDTEFNREVASKWLISACARLDRPGTKIDWMLIVVGPQKTGKTTMPSILFKDSNITLYGEQNDKDLHMLLHSALCVGFDELDSFNRRESSTLKAMVTRNEDSFRPPYGASVEVFPRRFTLYGCGNRHDFIQYDASGYRRYAVVEVSRLLDFAGLETERDQLWAEAWQRYQTGNVTYWEVEGTTEQAERFVVANPLEEKIEEFLYRKKVDKVTPTQGSIYFKMTEIAIHLGMDGQLTNSGMLKDVGAILHKMGCVKPDKTTRHPETGAVGRWWIWEPPP